MVLVVSTSDSAAGNVHNASTDKGWLIVFHKRRFLTLRRILCTYPGTRSTQSPQPLLRLKRDNIPS